MMRQHRRELHSSMPVTPRLGKRPGKPITTLNPHPFRIPAAQSPGYAIPAHSPIQAYRTSTYTTSDHTEHTPHIEYIPTPLSVLDALTTLPSTGPTTDTIHPQTFTAQQEQDLLRELDFLGQDFGQDPSIEVVDPDTLLGGTSTPTPGQTDLTSPTSPTPVIQEVLPMMVADTAVTADVAVAATIPVIPSSPLPDVVAVPEVPHTLPEPSTDVSLCPTVRMDLQPHMVQVILSLAQQLRSTTTRATQTDSAGTRDMHTQVQYMLHSGAEE